MSAEPSGLEKINKAAIHVMGLRGFTQATTHEISKSAGVSEGLIYRYYQSKLDLGLKLFREHYQEILDCLKEESSKHEDHLERLRCVAKAFYSWFDENTETARFLIRMHHEFLEPIEHKEGPMHMLNAVLKDILGEAMFQLFPSDIFSAMILGAILQVATESTHGQIKGPLAPRMGPIIDALAGFLAQADPIGSRGTHQEDSNAGVSRHDD